jgi:uncharacterized Zn-binding protein involved in type VI secretion
MGTPGAKKGDHVVGIDTHVVMVSTPGGRAPVPTPMPFLGELAEGLSSTVFIDNKPAAVKGSGASNDPKHEAVGGTFQKEPSNKASVKEGSSTVLFDAKPAARMGDPAVTCNDPEDAPAGTVIAESSVIIGG